TITPGPTTPPAAPPRADGGFEATAARPSEYIFNPSGSPWSFAGTAGVTGNGSALTGDGQAAPEGSVVAFLQMRGSISQDVAGWAAGSYVLSFQAAQRGNQPGSAEDLEVLVDGIVVGTVRPAGAAYQRYSTARFDVTAGTHTIA